MLDCRPLWQAVRGQQGSSGEIIKEDAAAYIAQPSLMSLTKDTEPAEGKLLLGDCLEH